MTQCIKMTPELRKLSLASECMWRKKIIDSCKLSSDFLRQACPSTHEYTHTAITHTHTHTKPNTLKNIF